MDYSSIDTYIRSLVVEALRLETNDIRITRIERGFRIEMRVGGEYVAFPHPPAKETVDLLSRLRELANLPPASNGHPQQARFHIVRRGQELPLGVTFRHEGGMEVAELQLI